MPSARISRLVGSRQAMAAIPRDPGQTIHLEHTCSARGKAMAQLSLAASHRASRLLPSIRVPVCFACPACSCPSDGGTQCNRRTRFFLGQTGGEQDRIGLCSLKIRPAPVHVPLTETGRAHSAREMLGDGCPDRHHSGYSGHPKTCFGPLHDQTPAYRQAVPVWFRSSLDLLQTHARSPLAERGREGSTRYAGVVHHLGAHPLPSAASGQAGGSGIYFEARTRARKCPSVERGASYG